MTNCAETKQLAIGEPVCVSPDCVHVSGPFDPFNAGDWTSVGEWSDKDKCEHLYSVRLFARSRLSPNGIPELLARQELRCLPQAPADSLLRMRVRAERGGDGDVELLVGAGGIDIYARSIRIELLVPPGIARASAPVAAGPHGALEMLVCPIVDRVSAVSRSTGRLHTYVVGGQASPIPPFATRFELADGQIAELNIDSGTLNTPAGQSGPTLGFQTITVPNDAVVAWEIEP